MVNLLLPGEGLSDSRKKEQVMKAGFVKVRIKPSIGITVAASATCACSHGCEGREEFSL